MEKEKFSDIKVGMFVTIGLGFLLLSIILLGGDSFIFTDFYHLKMSTEDAEGLASGSVVSLSGIRVGNVEELELGKENVIVHLNIDKNFRHRITSSSVATLKTQGALGDRFISISPGLPSETPLSEGESIPADNRKDFIDLLTKKGSEMNQITGVVTELHLLLKQLNEENRIALLLGNLNTSSEQVNATLAELRNLAKDIRGMSKEDSQLKQSLAHLSSILKKVDNGKGSLGALVNDKTLHNKLLNFMGGSPRQQFLKPLVRETIKSND